MADRRWLHNRYLFDTVLAAGCLAAVLGHLLAPGAGWDQDHALYRPYNAAAWAISVGLWLPVVWRRRFPVAVFFVGWLSVLGLVLGDFMVGALPGIGWLLMFTVGQLAPRRRVILSVVGESAITAVAGLSHYPEFGVLATVRNAAVVAIFALAGQLIQANRQASVTRLELAERRADLEAERARSLVISERLGLARDLHDVVAHSLSVIAVQAEVGMATVHTDPGRADTALHAISRTTRETLNELRLLLGVLRADGDDSSPLAPAPSLAQIGRLVERVEATGVTVDLHIDGDPGRVPSAIGLFAYRVIQEALTNVIKHARARAVAVSVAVGADRLHVRVRDDGRGPAALPAPGDGRGIVGMRERAAAHGGQLSAGPVPGGGFEVSATVPLELPA